jgi:hypothetical protein
VIGPKKLSEIQDELRRGFTATGDDPIHWLEERMTAPQTGGSAALGENEVLHSLRRFLARTGRGKGRRQGERIKQ